MSVAAVIVLALVTLTGTAGGVLAGMAIAIRILDPRGGQPQNDGRRRSGV